MFDYQNYTKEQLAQLVEIIAKNLVAIDGTWFQSVEGELGMDAAMRHDVAAWERFTVSEARRLKKFLQLDEQPGLEGLAKALPLHAVSIANEVSVEFDGEGALVLRVLDCRVQSARERKGMVFHPCKPAGFAEMDGFAKGIDSRIECECVSCYPDVTDATCNCVWRFTL